MVIVTLRQLQIPVLAVILLAACLAKLVRALRAGSVSAGLGPTALFARQLRRPAAIGLCLAELCLAAGLILTAGPAGDAGRWPSEGVRLATALLFVIALFALLELRQRRPDLGCGCFGDLSTTPVGARPIVRAGLLAAAALASVGTPPFRPPRPGPKAMTDLGILIAEWLIVAALSPEVGEALTRLGYTEPGELREVPARRALTSLRRSRVWRRHSHLITEHAPADMWRELSWWYVVFPARDEVGDCEAVFAVQVKPRRPAIRATVVRLAAADLEPLLSSTF